MSRPRKYLVELLDRAVREVAESGRPIAHVARDLGVGSEVLRKRVRQAEADRGVRPLVLMSRERDELKRLRRENEILRQERDLLKRATAFFAKETR